MDIGLETSSAIALSTPTTGSSGSGTKRNLTSAVLAISDHIAKKTSTIQENAARNSAVHTELAKKARQQERIQSVFRHLADCEKMVDDLEKLKTVKQPHFGPEG